MAHEHHIRKDFELRLANTFRELLENKHLYQSVTFNSLDFKTTVISGISNGLAGEYPVAAWQQALTNAFGSLERALWEFDSAEEKLDALLRAMVEKKETLLVRIPLQTIKIHCNYCDSIRPPHNPGYVGKSSQKISHILHQDSEVAQLFEATYQCQSCKGEPIVFLIHRRGLRLTLVGRSQFPEVLVPDFIPKGLRKFYSNAIIADKTNFTLAAALYLRTVIEQYFYQIIPKTEIQVIPGNPTGDELAELYAKTLPKSFPGKFPSLKKAYEDLSNIVHSGKEDEETKKSFETIRNAVDGHFKAVQLFKEMNVE